MVIEPILILVDLCWCKIYCDFNHSDIQRVLPISNSFLRLFGIRWLHHLDHKCRSSNHHYNCFLLKYWLQLCPLLLQPDPLLHDQPHPAVGLVHAKTHKTTTGQNDADCAGCDDGGNEENIFPALEFVFTQTQKQTQVISMWRFWWCLWWQRKNDDGGGDSFVAILLSNPSPIIGYACHSLTHSLTDV